LDIIAPRRGLREYRVSVKRSPVREHPIRGSDRHPAVSLGIPSQSYTGHKCRVAGSVRRVSDCVLRIAREDQTRRSIDIHTAVYVLRKQRGIKVGESLLLAAWGDVRFPTDPIVHRYSRIYFPGEIGRAHV